MLEIPIPGFDTLLLHHLVLDFNGTLAVDGQLLDGVPERLLQLQETLKVYVVTADTFGNVKSELSEVACDIHVLPLERQDESKRDFVQRLGPSRVVAVGNGRNDRLMLEEAALGIGLIMNEGAFSATLSAADVICRSITDALDLLRFPMRLTATLRS